MAEAQEALERRLAALERSREAGEDGAENPEHYAHTYDDDEFLLRPTLFGATGWDLSSFSYEQRRSADERRRDAPAPAPSGGDRVARRVAAARARAAALVGAAAKSKLRRDAPAEVVDYVVDYAVGGDALGAVFDLEVVDSEVVEAPALAWRRAPPGVARRAATGACCYVSHPAPRAFVASGPVAWKRRNPHVVFEPDGIARRHPSSRWHNFRTVVLDEEVASGAVAYDVAVLKLTGGAVAVGVVGEDARVNELNDWVLGLELETAALVAKGPALDREAPFDGLGLFSTARCAACGGDARARPTCSACGARGLDVRRASAAADRPALAAGDVVSLVVDRDAGSVAFAINGAAAGVAKAPPGALTLACSLMFASDAVAASRR